MEIRIKNGEEMIDATIEIVDGVIVVSQKKVKFDPKDGDVFCVDSLYPCIGIVTEVYDYGKPDKDRLYFSVGYWKQSESMQLGPFCACNRNTEPNYRPATEEEKKLLFDKLKEEGYEWDAEKKEAVKIKWKPKFDTIYYKPQLNVSQFRVTSVRWFNLKEEEELYQKGWVFQTNEDCAVLVKKLNQAIEGVKP